MAVFLMAGIWIGIRSVNIKGSPEYIEAKYELESNQRTIESLNDTLNSLQLDYDNLGERFDLLLEYCSFGK